MSLKAVLTLVGALAEFVALALVVRDFYDTRAQANELLPPPPAAHPGPPSHADVLFATTPTVEAIHHGQATEAALRESLATAFRGSARRKWWSIMLLAVGIACSAASNLL